MARRDLAEGLARDLAEASLFRRLALHRLGEIRKKLIGQFLGRTVDQPLPELGELAADLRLDIIGQQRTAILVGQSYRRATLGEPGDAALALARYLVAIGRIEITEHDPALEAGRHRSDLHFGHRAETVVLGSLQFLAAGDTRLEHFRRSEEHTSELQSPDHLVCRLLLEKKKKLKLIHLLMHHHLSRLR